MRSRNSLVQARKRGAGGECESGWASRAVDLRGAGGAQVRRGEGTGAVGAGASKRVGAACPRQAGQYTYSLECIWRRRPNPATATRTLRKTKAEAFATRSAILDAAEHLFQARGVSGTSLQDIAAAAGVTRGAVYWHFKDKGDLFNAMMARVCLPMETAALAASDTSPPLDALRAHLRGILERVAADAQVRRVFQIFTQKVEYVDEMATVRERHLQMRRDHLAVLARLLRAAQRRGDIVPAPPARQLAIGPHAAGRPRATWSGFRRRNRGWAWRAWERRGCGAQISWHRRRQVQVDADADHGGMRRARSWP